MAREVINVGAAPNDGTGDPIRTSFIKCNNNFGELYSRVQTNPPASLVGTIGDQAGMYAYDPNYFYYCFKDYDGVSVIWAEVTQIGNAAVQSIVNGTTSVAIPVSNGNVNINVSNIANVGTWTTSGLTMTGSILPSGNAAYDLGSASRQWRSLYVSNSSIWINDVQLTVQGTSLQVAGANVLTVSGANNISVGNITGTSISVTNATISNTLSINNDLNVTDDLSVGSDITSGGTITAGFFVGDGSGLTNLPGGGGGGGGNASQIVNGFSRVYIPSSSGPIDFDAGLAAGVVQISSSGLTVTGQISVAGNISQVTSTGNVTAPYFIGDGSLLTNLPGTGANAAQIANGTSKVAIATSNGPVQFDVGASANLMNLDMTGLAINSNLSLSGNVNALTSTGNITAPYFIGDGSQLTNVGGGGNYGNADVALFLQNYTGNITANNISLTNNANANIIYTSAVSATVVNASSVIGSLTGNVTGDVTGNTTGIHYGLVGSIDILQLSWDFGTITGVITNPVTWLINNIGGGFDAGNILVPNATDIDIGVLT